MFGKSRSVDREGTGMRILPRTKQYAILPRTYAQEFSFAIFSHLSEYKGRAGPAVGIEDPRTQSRGVHCAMDACG